MIFAIIIISLIFSAFFSGLEIAFVSRNLLKAELDKKSGSETGKLMENFYEHPSRFISTTLVGNNLALVIFGMAMATLLEPFFKSYISSDIAVVLLQTLVTTVIVLIFGEFLPKVIFRINPNGVLNFFSRPFNVIYRLLSPFTFLSVMISNGLLKRLFGVQNPDDSPVPVFSLLDISKYIQDSSTSEEEKKELEELVENTLELDEIQARDCIVPRTEIDAIEESVSMEERRQAFIESKHSRLVVYKDNIDNIVGYAHHHDLFKGRDKCYDIPSVPESMPAKDLLDLFLEKKRNIAWVRDEFGGTAGIVTLEDVLEEIFGEIRDEHDIEDKLERKIGEGEYTFAARLETDYLRKKYNLEIPEGDYETLAGYILSNVGKIPISGDHFEIDDFEFSILEASNKKIEMVKLKVINT